MTNPTPYHYTTKPHNNRVTVTQSCSVDSQLLVRVTHSRAETELETPYHYTTKPHNNRVTVTQSCSVDSQLLVRVTAEQRVS